MCVSGIERHEKEEGAAVAKSGDNSLACPWINQPDHMELPTSFRCPSLSSKDL